MALLSVVACRATSALGGASAELPGVSISHGVAWGLASAQSSTVGFRMLCREADTLLSVASPDGAPMLHATSPSGMPMVSAIPCAAGKPITLGGGGFHIMLSGARHGFVAGDSLVLDLQWARAGRLHLVVPVMRYSDAQALLNR